jgi:hypothetical protein
LQHPDHITLVEAEFGLPQILKLLPAIGSACGAAAALYLYHVVPQFTIDLTDAALGSGLYKFFNGKWLFDIVYNQCIINGGLQSFVIATLTLAIALFVFKPSFILNSTQLLALSLFNA